MKVIDQQGNAATPGFDINKADSGEGMSKVRLPSMGDLQGLARSLGDYMTHMETLAKSLQQAPGGALALPSMSFLPDVANSGLIQWPGFQPESLRKVAKEQMAPKTIIGMRVDDVQRYAGLSNQNWKPGWRVELKDGRGTPSAADLRDMRAAEEFLLNCSADVRPTQVRERDAQGYVGFSTFLALLTRDTLTYDGMAVWTDTDMEGRVRAFTTLPASNIRLANRETGYKGNPSIFAALMDDAGTPVRGFTRQELTWYVRNPRTDPDVAGYGWPEIEQAILFIQGLQDAWQMNANTFQINGTPNGMLVLKGDYWQQKQIDALARAWTNMKRGVTKQWALPAINVPQDGEMEVLDLSGLKDTDVRYMDYMNMSMGVACAMFRFPVRRLGYHTSGKTRDSEPLKDQSTEIQGDDDPGLAPLLQHIENVINPYILWTRWPHLRFVFTGKNPKEDAREYDARKNAQTWGEARAAADLPPLTEGTSGDIKELMEIMEKAPIDPNLSGMFQSLVAAKFKTASEGGDPEKKGNRMTSPRDPAKQKDHGHTPGVRRDSKKETA